MGLCTPCFPEPGDRKNLHLSTSIQGAWPQHTRTVCSVPTPEQSVLKSFANLFRRGILCLSLGFPFNTTQNRVHSTTHHTQRGLCVCCLIQSGKKKIKKKIKTKKTEGRVCWVLRVGGVSGFLALERCSWQRLACHTRLGRV